MTIYQAIFALALVFALIGIHQGTTKLIKLLDGHLERFQSKLDVLMAAQSDYNAKIDIILNKLL